MALGTIDYAASYFKYKIPMPIWGEPMNKALKRLQIELQANTSSVETDLRSRNHGYLALVLSNVEHTIILNIALFISPTYLSPLSIPTNATPI